MTCHCIQHIKRTAAAPHSTVKLPNSTKTSEKQLLSMSAVRRHSLMLPGGYLDGRQVRKVLCRTEGGNRIKRRKVNAK